MYLKLPTIQKVCTRHRSHEDLYHICETNFDMVCCNQKLKEIMMQTFVKHMLTVQYLC